MTKLTIQHEANILGLVHPKDRNCLLRAIREGKTIVVDSDSVTGAALASMLRRYMVPSIDYQDLYVFKETDNASNI